MSIFKVWNRLIIVLSGSNLGNLLENLLADKFYVSLGTLKLDCENRFSLLSKRSHLVNDVVKDVINTVVEGEVSGDIALVLND